jgi:hypothetical protein
VKKLRAAVMLLWVLRAGSRLPGVRLREGLAIAGRLGLAVFSEYRNGFRWIAVRAINSIDQFKD